jgi:hypothetical protein
MGFLACQWWAERGLALYSQHRLIADAGLESVIIRPRTFRQWVTDHANAFTGAQPAR